MVQYWNIWKIIRLIVIAIGVKYVRSVYLNNSTGNLISAQGIVIQNQNLKIILNFIIQYMYFSILYFYPIFCILNRDTCENKTLKT